MGERPVKLVPPNVADFALLVDLVERLRERVQSLEGGRDKDTDRRVADRRLIVELREDVELLKDLAERHGKQLADYERQFEAIRASFPED